MWYHQIKITNINIFYNDFFPLNYQKIPYLPLFNSFVHSNVIWKHSVTFTSMVYLNLFELPEKQHFPASQVPSLPSPRSPTICPHIPPLLRITLLCLKKGHFPIPRLFYFHPLLPPTQQPPSTGKILYLCEESSMNEWMNTLWMNTSSNDTNYA